MGTIVANRSGIGQGDPSVYTFRTVDPSAIAGVGQLYWKEVAAGEHELFVRDEDSGIDIVQITDGNALNAAAVDHGGLGGIADDDHTQYALVAGRAAEDLTVQGGLIVATVGPTGAKQHTLPDVASDTVALLAAAQTLTTKSVDLASNTLTGTAAEFATACSDDTFAYISDKLDVFAATTSAELAGVISDETGSSLLVFNTSPTLVTPDVNGGTVDSLTALSIRSTGAAFDLTLATATVFTAGRTLTIDPGDAARTITLSGNPTLDDWFDQDVKATASPTFVNLTITSFAAGWTNAGRTIADLGTVTTADINGGTIDGVTIGGASAGTIAGTTITADDMAFSSGAVLSFNAGDVTVTHGANTLAIEGGQLFVGRSTEATGIDIVSVGKNFNGATAVTVINETDGTGAYSLFAARAAITAGGTFSGFLMAIAEGNTEGSGRIARSVEVMANADATGGLNIRHLGAFPIIATINGSEAWRTLATGQFIVGSATAIDGNSIIEARRDSNASTVINVVNNTNGTAGAASLILRASDGAAGLLLGAVQMMSAGFTPASGLIANALHLDNVHGTAGIVINNRTASSISFNTNATTEMELLSGGGLNPGANDRGSLGASGTAWADLFLASGAVINFNAGNFTATHSAGLLTLSGNLSLADLTITSFAANWTNAGRTIADLGIVTTVDINGGTVDGVTIGGASAGAITGTTITAGAMVVGATTITAANNDAVDVTNISHIRIDTSGNNVALGGTVNAIVDQVLHVSVSDATNDATMENNEGTGNQDFQTHKNADETLDSEFGGWTFIFDGTTWLDISHAQHV